MATNFVQMLWLPHTHTTRSGKVFSPHYAPLPPLVTALQREDFDFAPLIAHTVASECNNQEDHEDGGNFDDIDDEWPPHAVDSGGIDNAWPTSQPWAPDDVDGDSPTPATSKRHSHPPYPEIHHVPPPDYSVGYPPPLKKRRHSSPNLAQVLATASEPQTGAHQHRSFKGQNLAQAMSSGKSATKAANRHCAATSPMLLPSKRMCAVPLAAGFDTSSLPTASGAYSAKVKNKRERYGSKVRRSLTNLLGLGFQLYAASASRQAQTDHRRPRWATAAFNTIHDAGLEARFPVAMQKHRRGLFAAINVGLSYGKGQKTPCWLSNKEYSTLTDGLLANLEIQ
ncbi:hypothetical protein B0H14DRAFT_3512063 [Mycena olivaceomarginata]|nr:hypothetical protein B0H14DRAFT_3512063 [Mycena olivaceomarginata]